MKKLLISLTAATALFAASDCTKVLDKIDAQITKAESAKKPNQARIDYLNAQKEQISAACKDGKIDTNELNEIKSKAKYDFESAQLAEKEAKLAAKKELIEAKRKADIEKLEAKKAKAAEKESKKAEKAKLKAEKKAEKEAQKAAKKAAKAEKQAETKEK